MKLEVKFILALLFWVFVFSFGLNADTGTYIVKFVDGYIPDTAEYCLEEVYAGHGLYLTADTEKLKPIENYIESISRNEEVFLIEDGIGFEAEVPEAGTAFNLLSLPNDRLYSLQWNIEMTNINAAWELETYGNEIRVAVIDSGCDPHPDIGDNKLEGKNYFDNTTDVTDNNGHGTHVSGIIAAQMNNIGIAGIASKAKIVPLKCFDPDEQTLTDDLVSAIYDAVDLYKCRVINMSWGSASDIPELKRAIKYAAGKGVILVASAGNYGSDEFSYPAAYDEVICVSSVNEDKEKSDFAQYFNGVTVVAPGEQIPSTYKGGDKYVYMTGTSQATPLVAGMAAIALSIDDNMTNTKFMKLLISTAEDLGDEGYDIMYGYGLVNMEALIDAVFTDIPYYVSPINTRDDEAYVLVKNNTEEYLSAISIFSKYAGKRFAERRQYIVTLPPNEATIVRTVNSEKHELSHFLWGSAEYIRPFTSKRDMLK